MAAMVSISGGQRAVAARSVPSCMLNIVLACVLISGIIIASSAHGEVYPATWQVTAPTDTFWRFPLSKDVMNDAEGFLILANTSHLLTSSDKPADLVNITARKTSSDTIQMRRPVSIALTAMFDAAKLDGITLYAASGYRSYQTQRTMFANRLDRIGYDDKMVQQAGASDHQTGMGIDVVNKAMIGSRFDASFIKTNEGQWLADHCAEYGFVIRYPKGKEDVTGINYEPWHLRFVGLTAARYMTDASITLEELWDQWNAYQMGLWEADVMPIETPAASAQAVNPANPANPTNPAQSEPEEEDVILFDIITELNP